jgi:hypothetical protein
MQRLHDQTKTLQILGALMFTCNGRGPTRNDLMNDDMVDATTFAQYFPNVPCVGFYAGGEIGPMALAGCQSTFHNGKAALQGFTAVFALFIVPQKIPQHQCCSTSLYHVDDSTDSVREFIHHRWLHTWTHAKSK